MSGYTPAPGTREDFLLDHEYDGIREFDNPTPSWWHLIFLASIVFSVFYMTFFHLSPEAWTHQDSWQAQQVAEYKRIFGAVGNLEADEATIVKMSGDQKMLQVARTIFIANCAQCHEADGGGKSGSGVNLCDESYKNARTISDLYKVITQGAAAGAMPAWENKLSQNERVILSSFVATLRGTTPKNPQPAAGEVIPAFPTPAKTGDPSQ